MKPRFQNIPVDCWLDKRLGVADQSICLAPHGLPDDVTGAILLLEALDELKSATLPAQRVLATCASSHRSRIGMIRLVLCEETDDLKQLAITCTGDIATVEMTLAGWKIVRDGIEGWREGGEDFGVGPISVQRRLKDLGAKDRQSAELWFWRFLLP